MIGIFLDTETNGLNSHIHKIIEIAFKIVDLTSGQLKTEFQTLIVPSSDEWERSDRESMAKLSMEKTDDLEHRFDSWKVLR